MLERPNEGVKNDAKKSGGSRKKQTTATKLNREAFAGEKKSRRGRKRIFDDNFAFFFFANRPSISFSPFFL